MLKVDENQWELFEDFIGAMPIDLSMLLPAQEDEGIEDIADYMNRHFELIVDEIMTLYHDLADSSGKTPKY